MNNNWFREVPFIPPSISAWFNGVPLVGPLVIVNKILYSLNYDAFRAVYFWENPLLTTPMNPTIDNGVKISGQIIEDNTLTRTMVLSKDGNLRVRSIMEYT